MRSYFLLFLLLMGGCSLFRQASSSIPTPEMVLISGGTFTMGDIYGDGNTDATPTHVVTVDDFRIGKFEVTYQQYDAFAKRTGRPLPEADSLGRSKRSVVNVSWEQAQAFCAFHGWRLPTEQEWEYAARAGGKKMRYAGTNNRDSLDIYARTTANSAPYAFKGGTKKPNSTGLFDMSGNVYEWIGGYYQFYPKQGEQPQWEDLQKRGVRIIRGGSFKEPKGITATYWRVGILKDAQGHDIGFRCVDPIDDSS